MHCAPQIENNIPTPLQSQWFSTTVSVYTTQCSYAFAMRLMLKLASREFCYDRTACHVPCAIHHHDQSCQASRVLDASTNSVHPCISQVAHNAFLYITSFGAHVTICLVRTLKAHTYPESTSNHNHSRSMSVVNQIQCKLSTLLPITQESSKILVGRCDAPLFLKVNDMHVPSARMVRSIGSHGCLQV